MSSERHGQVSSTYWPAVRCRARMEVGFSSWRTTHSSSATAHSPRGLRCCFPPDGPDPLQPKAFDDACEIVGAPTVTQNQCNSDGLRISARRESVQMFAEEVLDAFIDVELLDQELHQAGGPAKPRRSANRRTGGFRPGVAAPTLVRGLRRAGRSCRARFRTRVSGRDTASIAVAGRWHGDLWRSGWREPPVHSQCHRPNGGEGWICATSVRAPGSSRRDRGIRYPERNRSTRRPDATCAREGVCVAWPGGRLPRALAVATL